MDLRPTQALRFEGKPNQSSQRWSGKQRANNVSYEPLSVTDERCGYCLKTNHTTQDCKFKEAVCENRDSNMRGHKAVYCRTFHKQFRKVFGYDKLQDSSKNKRQKTSAYVFEKTSDSNTGNMSPTAVSDSSFMTVFVGSSFPDPKHILLDSGATGHFCGDKSLLRNIVCYTYILLIYYNGL